MAKPKRERSPKSPTKNMELLEVFPMTKRQEQVFSRWENGQHLFLAGSAGTGKTFLAMYLALAAVEDNVARKVIVVRSAVPSRNIGFLPGNLREKAEVYEDPYRDNCIKLYDCGTAYETLKAKNVVEFWLSSYLRGLTIDNAIVVVDEAQNMSAHELGTILTRAGDRTRFIFAGDYAQSDLASYEKKDVLTFLKIIDRMPSFTQITFGIDDVVRSGIVKEYLIAKEAVGGDQNC